MKRKVLTNKPLVEAIFELHWELQEPQRGIRVDPHYQLLIGSVYDRVKDKYPFHEPLPTSAMPEGIGAYVVQHRFRKAEDEWPLIQIGPGIVTLNDTEGYIWETFRDEISCLLNALWEAYPDAENSLQPDVLLLRYIDAVDFDYKTADVFHFLKEELKTSIDVYEKLFDDTEVGTTPLELDLKLSFPSSKPTGAMHLRLVRGQRNDVDALIWETMVRSAKDDAPEDKDKVLAWVDQAHILTDDWFFKMIEGGLERRFA